MHNQTHNKSGISIQGIKQKYVTEKHYAPWLSLFAFEI